MEKLALLIPCFNEENVIRRTIESVLAAGLSAVNIFVIDDCSRDKSAEIAMSLGVTVVINAVNIGKTRGIESAIITEDLASRYDFIAILDADTMIDPDYFKYVLETFNLNRDTSAVCGQPMSLPHNWLTAFRAFEYALIHFIYKDAQNVMGTITISAGCATTYRSSVLAAIQWHPEEIIIEDADFAPQAHRRKLGKIRYDKRARVYTQDPATISAYTKQCRRWYTGIWQAWRVYKIPFGCQKIDLESLLLGGETLFSSLFFLLFPAWFFLNPGLTIWAVVISFFLNTTIAACIALKLKRLDIFVSAPLFVVPRTISRVVFLISFWDAIILRKKAGVWFKPARYQNQQPKEKGVRNE